MTSPEEGADNSQQTNTFYITNSSLYSFQYKVRPISLNSPTLSERNDTKFLYSATITLMHTLMSKIFGID